jgi:hypothetical protein
MSPQLTAMRIEIGKQLLASHSGAPADADVLEAIETALKTKFSLKLLAANL